MKEILYALLILGGMGLLFGAGLAFAGKIFAVKKDEREGRVRELLAGANCGICGYPGCDAYAAAVVAEGAAPNRCSVSGAEAAVKIAEIMGVEALPLDERKVAIVRCMGDKRASAEKFEYDGILDCRSSTVLFNGPKTCATGCLGMGSCMRACPFGAITVENRLARINPEVCTGCGKCVETCPRNVIALVPKSQPVKLVCQTRERGKVVKQFCNAGCIGCGICAKNCPTGAIVMKDNLPVIDQSKCTACYVCVESCPSKTLLGDISLRARAQIDPGKCTGCSECKAACPFDAIEGTPKLLHGVKDSMCKGCGLCLRACQYDAISMIKPN